jgi:hypothetical protein
MKSRINGGNSAAFIPRLAAMRNPWKAARSSAPGENPLDDMPAGYLERAKINSRKCHGPSINSIAKPGFFNIIVSG